MMTDEMAFGKTSELTCREDAGGLFEELFDMLMPGTLPFA